MKDDIPDVIPSAEHPGPRKASGPQGRPVRKGAWVVPSSPGPVASRATPDAIAKSADSGGTSSAVIDFIRDVANDTRTPGELADRALDLLDDAGSGFDDGRRLDPASGADDPPDDFIDELRRGPIRISEARL